MSFEEIEESRFLGEPITLYFFRYGTGANSYYAYTDAESAVSHLGVTYEAIPIDRAAISASGTLDKAALEIRTPQNIKLADLFRIYPPANVVTLVIYQGHVSDTSAEFLAIWTGRIISYALEGNEARFTGEPVSTSLRRPGLRRHYQYGCPHALYGPQCRASQSAATSLHTALAVDSTTVTLPSSWAGSTDPDKYIGGMISWTNGSETELRTILRITGGNVLQVAGLLRGLIPGTQVATILGCDHTMNDCQALHNNILNYGGQPWIPTKNPLGTTNNYY